MITFRVIGVDGREYGPATAEHLRQWIQEGRANGQTVLQVVGTNDWRPLATFPEFADALRAKAPPPVGRHAEQAQAREETQTILERDYDLGIGECLDGGWRLVTGNFWALVGGTFLYLLVTFVVASIPSLGLATLLLSGTLNGGLCWLFLRRLRGEKAGIEEIFAGFTRAFVQSMLVGVIMCLLIALGWFFCILPGIFLSVCWWFAPLLVVDKRMDFWPAMELSRRMVMRHWWTVFLLFVLAGLVALSGILFCCIGFLFTLPLAIAAGVCAYEKIFGAQPTAPGLAPLTPLTPAPISPAPTPTTSASTSTASAIPSTPSAPAPAAVPAEPPARSSEFSMPVQIAPPSPGDSSVAPGSAEEPAPPKPAATSAPAQAEAAPASDAPPAPEPPRPTGGGA